MRDIGTSFFAKIMNYFVYLCLINKKQRMDNYILYRQENIARPLFGV